MMGPKKDKKYRPALSSQTAINTKKSEKTITITKGATGTKMMNY